jgi:hypothetical protein
MYDQQNWHVGLDLAKAALRQLRPQLVRWTMQQPELWQHYMLSEEMLADERWMWSGDI